MKTVLIAVTLISSTAFAADIADVQLALSKPFQFHYPDTPKNRRTFCANALRRAGQAIYRNELKIILHSLDITYHRDSTVGDITLALAQVHARLGDEPLDDVRRRQIERALGLLGLPDFEYGEAPMEPIRWRTDIEITNGLHRIIDAAIRGEFEREPVQVFGGQSRRP